MQHKIGATVFDFPSNRPATVIAIAPLGDLPDSCYILDDSTPLDPTGDGAYPTRSRLESEVCALGQQEAKRSDWSY